MAKFQIDILGCGSATPSVRHNPSGQIINFRDRLMMVDCGEGSQLAMRRMGIGFNRLGTSSSAIFTATIALDYRDCCRPWLFTTREAGYA